MGETLKPIRENVLIRPLPSDTISEYGIYVPDTVQQRNSKAVVIAAGQGTKKYPMEFKKDMIIHTIKGAGEEIIIDGVKHYIVKCYDILARN